VILALALASTRAVPPTVLVAQLMTPPVEGVDHNLAVDSRMGQALDEVGQVVPVVWSISDPYIRAANSEGTIEFDPHATQQQIRAAADKLRIPYVLFVTAFKENNSLRALAYLYRGRDSRPMWRFGEYDRQSKYKPRLFVDEKSKDNVAKVGDVSKVFESLIAYADGLPDWDSTTLTLARTWSELLGATAFKDLPKRPRLNVPKDPNTNLGGTDPVQPQPEEGVALKKQIDALVAAERPALAVLTLREAIDRSPYDPVLRQWLVELLTKQGFLAEAAQEARRAAKLTPSAPEPWLASARAWLSAGQPQEAQADLDVANRNNAKGLASMAVLGDILLAQNRLSDAMAAYSASISAGPTPEAVVGRAVARGLLGDAEGCKADLKAVADASPASLDGMYVRAVELISQSASIVSASCRELIPLARHAPKTTAVVARAAALQRQTLALSNLVAQLPTPKRFEKSQAERDLAHKLLAQCGQEILDLATSGDDNLGDEATMSLSEALELLPYVQSVYQLESRGQDR